MGDFRDPRLHAVDEGNRAINLPKRPQRDRKIPHRADARVESEAKGQIIITARLKHFERPFEVIPRLAISSREPAGDSRDAMRHGSLRGIGSRRDVVEKRLRVSRHRRKLAPHVAANPETVGARQLFGRIFIARCGLASSSEGFGCFRSRIAAHRDQRVAVGDVQLTQPLVR